MTQRCYLPVYHIYLPFNAYAIKDDAMPHLDFTQPPFDVLSAAERQSIKKNTQVLYLAKDEMLSTHDLQYF